MFSIRQHYADLLAHHEANKKSFLNVAHQSGSTKLTSQIVDFILSRAVAARASDLHIEQNSTLIKIRLRVDGKLYDVLEIKESPDVNILPRLKILANLPTDVASSRKARDGRFSMVIDNQKYDFRIATFPTVVGEKIAIRVLNKDSTLVNLDKIGLTDLDRTNVERIAQRKDGLIIVSGPTGAGKTTTLYAILNRLHTSFVNIVTLEDPVEYQIDGINQCDIKKTGEEDFISGLKAILRQDPDIILVGEIRDQESAEIALRASITGHLVLTSLHANSAIGTIIRLLNMGIDRHLVSYALIGTLAQRLVRRVCDKCRTPYKIDAPTLNKLCIECGIDAHLFIKPVEKTTEGGMHYLSDETDNQNFIFYKGKGCNHCGGTGYRGRIMIAEVVQFTQELRDAIIANKTSAELEHIAAKSGFRPLIIDAIQKVRNGLITLDDIYPILLEKSA